MFGYKQIGLDMKEFNEKKIFDDELYELCGLDELAFLKYNEIKYKIIFAIYEKKCNLIKDYISKHLDANKQID